MYQTLDKNGEGWTVYSDMSTAFDRANVLVALLSCLRREWSKRLKFLYLMLISPDFSKHIVSRVSNYACRCLTVDSHFSLHSITTLSKTSFSFPHSVINTVLPTYLILLYERLTNNSFYSFFFWDTAGGWIAHWTAITFLKQGQNGQEHKKKSTPVSLPWVNLKGFGRSAIHTLGRYSKSIQIFGYISF